MSWLRLGSISNKKVNRNERFSSWRLVLFAAIFSAVGGAIIWYSLAANPNLPGDLNNDNVVSVTDLSILLSHYGTNFAGADVNSDGMVTVLDLSILLSHYGQTYSAGSTCTVSNQSGCESSGGTTITLQNVSTQQGPGNSGFLFKCTGALKDWTDPTVPARAGITETGSGWPVHLNINFTLGTYNYSSNPGQPISPGTIVDQSAVALSDGCTGDGDPSTIDLIVHIQGDGRTYGVQTDAFKLVGSGSGPHDIQVTTGSGSINCGPREGANALTAVHQDNIQIQNGNNVGFYGVTAGDWANQRATCWGAGGAFFLSAANGHTGQNITVSHMKAVACNHGLNGDGGGLTTNGTALNSVFRTGRPSDQTDVLSSIDNDTGTNTVGLCDVSSAPVSANTLSLSNWTFTLVSGDAWAQTGQAWSPGYNPAYNNGL